MFETGLGEKVTAYDNGKIILQLQLLDEKVNTLKVTNVSWSPDLGHNLLSTISFVKKRIEVFLRRTGQLSEIFFEDEVVGLADTINNQYVIRLAKPSILKVNVVKILHLGFGILGWVI